MPHTSSERLLARRLARTPAATPTRDLVRRAQRADADAFARLYDANIRPVSRYIGAILKDVDAAEDIAAQTFLLAWQNLPHLRNPDQFDAWLFRIAHNQALNAVRKRRPQTPLDNAPEFVDTNRFNSPAQRVDDQFTHRRLRTALLQLSNLHREVLILRFLGERSHAEIGLQLGKSEVAVRSIQYRALRQLRRGLTPPPPEPPATH